MVESSEVKEGKGPAGNLRTGESNSRARRSMPLEARVKHLYSKGDLHSHETTEPKQTTKSTLNQPKTKNILPKLESVLAVN